MSCVAFPDSLITKRRLYRMLKTNITPIVIMADTINVMKIFNCLFIEKINISDNVKNI